MSSTLTLNEREQVFDVLINDCAGCGWRESDRRTLRTLSDRSLAALVRQGGLQFTEDGRLVVNGGVPRSSGDEDADEMAPQPTFRFRRRDLRQAGTADADAEMVPPTINWEGDPMDAAGGGPRGGAKGTGKKDWQADGDVAPYPRETYSDRKNVIAGFNDRDEEDEDEDEDQDQEMAPPSTGMTLDEIFRYKTSPSYIAAHSFAGPGDGRGLASLAGGGNAAGRADAGNLRSDT